MDKKELPEGVTENSDGTVDIALRKALTIDGAPVKALRMREPTVADQLTADKTGGSDADKEIATFAALCMVKPSDLHALTLRDYKRVQAAYVLFAS
jgi:hypothetical protein